MLRAQAKHVHQLPQLPTELPELLCAQRPLSFGGGEHQVLARLLVVDPLKDLRLVP